MSGMKRQPFKDERRYVAAKEWSLSSEGQHKPDQRRGIACGFERRIPPIEAIVIWMDGFTTEAGR